MWPLLAAAGIQAATSIIGGQSQAKAAKQAAAESARAAAESRQILGANRDYVQDLYEPNVQMGQNVLGQLGQNYGVGEQAQPDWNAYIAQNPDVAEIQAILSGQAQGTPDQMNFIAGFQQSGASNLGEYHASVVPGRAVPTTGGAAPTAYQDPTAPQGYGVAPYQAPAAYAAPTRPNIAPLDVSLGQYEASPDYLYQLTEGQKSLNSGYAAKGLLQSGAAMKALTKFGQDSALEDYSQWRGFKQGQYQFDANRSDQNFQFDANFGRQSYESDRSFGRSTYESDRNYGAGRYDTYQNRLFDLANIGERAMDRTAGASSDYANGVAGIINQNGQTQGQAKIASANALSQGWAGAAGAASRAVSGMGGSGNILGNMGSSSSYGGGYGNTNGGYFDWATSAPRGFGGFR